MTKLMISSIELDFGPAWITTRREYGRCEYGFDDCLKKRRYGFDDDKIDCKLCTCVRALLS